jgi:anthranilate synthase component 1
MAEFSLERVYDIAEELGYPCIIPLVRVVRTELEPTDVYASLRKTSKLSFLLESAEIGEKIARYSFLGNSPEKLITLKDGVLNINGEEKSHVVEPMEELRKLLAGYRVYENRLPRFHGGLLGYFSYDLIRYIEKIGENVKDDLKHNDAEFMLVRDLITYDHWRDEVLLISNLMLLSEE